MVIDKKVTFKSYVIVTIVAVTIVAVIICIAATTFIPQLDKVKENEQLKQTIAEKNQTIAEKDETIDLLESDKNKVVIETEDKKVVISSDLIQKNIVEIGEFATYEYHYQTVAKFEESATTGALGYLPDWVTSKSILAIYDGVVKVGVDLKKIDVKVDDTRKTITVLLPEAKILSHETLENSFEVYDEKSNIFNPIDADDSMVIVEERKEVTEKELIASGVYSEATENAKKIIKPFIEKSSEDYKILFANK